MEKYWVCRTKFAILASLSILLLSPLVTKSQLIVTKGMTPQQYVQNVLAGSGVVITNVTYSGSADQIGEFDATNTEIYTSQNIKDGLILSTGDVINTVGPNTLLTGSNDAITFFANDSDLDSILKLPLIPGNDAVILEFDFIPSGDTIQFNYIFGSEEYTQFVNAGYNDVFGFFLSGPGITGPFTNNAINLAQLPSGAPITIDSVNHLVNTSYYVDNGGSFPPAPFSTDPKYIQFNGHTINLNASAKVVCGQTYHLKLALQDMADGSYDSGVFLQAGSLSSNSIRVDLVTATGNDTIIEGCSPATFSLIRPDTIDSLVVDINWYGNAINGTDYVLMPDSALFLPGKDTLKLYVDPIADGLNELIDTVLLEVVTINLCGDTVRDSAYVYILDEPFMQSNLQDIVLECPQSTYQLATSVWGSESPYTFAWSDPNGNTWTGNPVNLDVIQNPHTYYVTIQSSCTPIILQDTFTITTLTPPALNIVTGNDIAVQCPGTTSSLSTTTSGGTTPYSYSWSNGSTTNPTNVTPNTTTQYSVTVTDKCGRTDNDNITVTVSNTPTTLSIANDVSFTCPGPHNVNAWVTPLTGEGPFSYLWSNGATDSATIIVSSNTQTISVEVTDACGQKTTASMNINFGPYTAISGSIIVPDSSCADELVNVSSTANGGILPHNFNWSDGTKSWNGQTSSFIPQTIGQQTVFLNIVDACGVSKTLSSPIFVYPCKVSSTNVFTPNNDGLNDVLIFKNLHFFPESKLTVFNRWGRKVYENMNYLNNWEATNVKDGTYYYVLDINNTDQTTLKGTITILK